MEHHIQDVIPDDIHDPELRRAILQNRIVHRYVIALGHALLWVTALSFAAYFHLSARFSHSVALLLSTLVAYGAYLCESALATVKEAAAASLYEIDFRKAGLWQWIGLNILVNAVLSVLFLYNPNWIYLVLIILTAGWQKYMDGRIPPRLEASRRPLTRQNTPPQS